MMMPIERGPSAGLAEFACCVTSLKATTRCLPRTCRHRGRAVPLRACNAPARAVGQVLRVSASPVGGTADSTYTYTLVPPGVLAVPCCDVPCCALSRRSRLQSEVTAERLHLGKLQGDAAGAGPGSHSVGQSSHLPTCHVMLPRLGTTTLLCTFFFLPCRPLGLCPQGC